MAAIPLPEERTCRECQRSLPLASSFGRNPSSADGWESVCKACVQERSERTREERRTARPNVATIRPVEVAWTMQKTVEREIDQRAKDMQSIIAEARPLHPLSRDRQAQLTRMQQEQDAAYERLRRVRAEFKLAVIAADRPEQLKEYQPAYRWAVPKEERR